MAQSPRFKCYDANGTYQAAVKDLTLAGAVMGCLGDGATIRLDHRRTIYREGRDGNSGESIDAVASFVLHGKKIFGCIR